MNITNRFGSGELFGVEDIIEYGKERGGASIYCESCACLSVTSDMLSWISGQNSDNPVEFTSRNEPGLNNVIIVLGCQVTDLSILNDIKTIERLHCKNPDADIYIGGCLAYRFDIPLPSYVKRLQPTRSRNVALTEDSFKSITWQKPFWVADDAWKNNDGEFSKGRLFRDMYPLKIGAGCHGKCKYCTIRDTRGEAYEEDAFSQLREFLDHDNIVLVSDSPTADQIRDWAYIAKQYNKPISIRNVEPNIAVKVMPDLLDLAKLGLLKVFHCPIQSNDAELIKAMGRDVISTLGYIEYAQQLRQYGTKVATNVIIDYTVVIDGKTKTFRNMDIDWLNEHFDYWVWNPYFDGHWDVAKAEERFAKYIGNA